MASGVRIQLCGRMAVRIGERRVEDDLPGRQGRLLLAFLALSRRRPVERDTLVDALWPERAPAAADSAVNALLSKLRRALAPIALEGRSTLALALPDDAWIDVEAAGEALHRAEAAVAREDWADAWGPARVVQHVTARPLLPGEDLPWIADERRRLDDMHLRSLELAAEASLGIGASEVDTAERAARELVARAPFRESGHRLLMRVHAARGNAAEALRVYEGLRTQLRDELGVAPGPATQALHGKLLRG